MNTLKLLLGPILALVGASLSIFEIEVTQDQLDTVGQAVMIITGVVVSMFSTFKKPKGGANLLVAALLLPVCLASVSVTQTGCQTLDSETVKKVVIPSAVRVLTYAVVNNNPELAPVFGMVSSILKAQDKISQDENIREIVTYGLTQGGVDPGKIQLIDIVIQDIQTVQNKLISTYTAEGLGVPPDEVRVFFDQMGFAIDTGVMMAGTPPGVTDSPGVQSVNLSKAQIVFD
jgi:hypothetical protein